VFSDKKYVLRGPCEYIINCAFDKRTNKDDFVFMPHNEKFTDRNFIFAREIVSIKNGFIPLRVYILSEEEIVIHKNTEIGFLEKVEKFEVVKSKSSRK